MHWEKCPPELIERFGRVMDRFPELDRRMMFGYPAAFLGGNMVTGLHAARWVIRLGDEALGDMMAAGGTTFEPMAGRPMKSFAVLPHQVVTDDAPLVRGSSERSLTPGRCRRRSRTGVAPS